MTTEASAVQRELELIARFGLHPVRHGDRVLVARDEAIACLHGLLVADEVDLWGFDAFTLNDDDTLTPHPDSSPDYSESTPPVEEIEAAIRRSSDAITHFDFVVGIVEPWEE